MKKLIIGISLVFILASCQPVDDFNDKIVINNSTYTITFKYTDFSEHTLALGESVRWVGKKSGHFEKKYTNYKYVDFIFTSNGQNYGGGTGTFKDRASYTVRVNNTINENVSLSEEFLEENDLINIVPGNTNDDNHTGTIYTGDPKFTAQTENGFPAVCVCSFDNENNTFMVTIRW
jgi:hypothetical protein